MTFAAPLALLALAMLPLLWLILRATPPAPLTQRFPPLRLLLGLRTADEAKAKAPWWLILLRLTILALAIIGLARPSLAPRGQAEGVSGRVLIVVDDGWTAAPGWSAVRSALQAAAADLENQGGEAHLLLTAPAAQPWSAAEALTPGALRGRAAQLQPKPWRPDRADAAARLEASGLTGVDRVLWLSDGVAGAGDAALAQALQRLGPVRLRAPDGGPRALVDAAAGSEGVRVVAIRSPQAPPIAAVAAETLDGRSLGVADLRFVGGRAEALIALPAEIAARTARVRLIGEDSAGALRLLPEGSSRPLVGLADQGAGAQPLLSELYYVERALQPYASLQRGGVSALVAARAQAIVLPDASRLAPEETQRLTRWLDNGGLLIRFAGPRLANDADALVPVALRGGARALGSALAWEQPQPIAPFAPESPFAGLVPPPDVVVRQQLLAAPGATATARVWATLQDGSPLITAAPRGDGLIVLFHVTAGPAWSDLPLSGLYVQMLRRVIAFAGQPGAQAAGAQGPPELGGAPYRPLRLLDGFGALRDAGAGADPIAAAAFASAAPGPATPPGLYERAGLAGAIDAAGPADTLERLEPPEGITVERLNASRAQPLAGFFLGLAAALAALDLLVSLLLAGRLPPLPPLRKSAAISALAAGVVLALAANPAKAQQTDPTLTLRLAYVATGEGALDRMSNAGLTALSETLFARTAVEPGPPMAVDLARDDLSVFPFIYWPAPAAPQALSPAALANLDRYLRLGGMLLVDTRDAGGAGSSAGPAAVMLRGLDAPPLDRVDGEHVVARSFYLLRGFPGRHAAPELWAETESAAAARDGVASLFVGDGDWAAAWAGDAPSLSARQRELALRFGVNLVMVSLTGNYKADQVHVPALLERLGREGRP